MRTERAFRGISKRLAIHYLENLGGERVSGDPEGDGPVAVTGEGWDATLTDEKVSAVGSFRLTEVTVAFEGEEATLDDLVENFARKAMRAGG
jgi:molybdopterin synthase sulfur carrier subunit